MPNPNEVLKPAEQNIESDDKKSLADIILENATELVDAVKKDDLPEGMGVGSAILDRTQGNATLTLFYINRRYGISKVEINPNEILFSHDNTEEDSFEKCVAELKKENFDFDADACYKSPGTISCYRNWFTANLEDIDFPKKEEKRKIFRF